MPRPEKPIRTVGPVAVFAQRLRDLRTASGRTYRQMARVARYADGTLADAARGEKMPTWPLTRGYIKACGITDEKATLQWERDWRTAKQASRMIPSHRRLTSEEMPDPRRVRTYDELLEQLGKLKIAAGNMPYRSFYFGTPSLTSNSPAPLPASTVSDLFTGKHVGRLTVFAQVVQGLVRQVISLYGQPDAEEKVVWHDVAAWHHAWRRALEAHHQRKIEANRAQENLAELISWLAADFPAQAAAALAKLDPQLRERVLQDLPLDVATAIRQSSIHVVPPMVTAA